MTESTKCPQCSGEMPANFPPGVCPACLLKQGMSPSTLTGAAGEGSGASGSGSNVGGRRHSWTPPTPAALAPKFPQLEIAELLGQGGMGAVYKVRQKELDRWAALKILPDEVASDPNFAERFQREARALAQLSHQHIVTVYEFGQRDGVFFLLMEFVDGVTLRQAGRAGQVAAQDALGIVTQLCDALQFAHEEGIVHRDIKPENILIDKRGRVKIADFGLAKLLGKQPNFPTLTGMHQIMGTPVYMAPEQMEGTKGVDHRADIFSLGVVFYELLTGELPLGRFAPPSQKYSLDVRLDEVVLRTLEKEPDRRYQQASEVKLDVETIRSQPVAAKASPSKMPQPAWSFVRLAFLAFLALMTTFAGLVTFLLIMSFRWYSIAQISSEGATPVQPMNTSAAQQQQAAAQRYVADVQFQKQEQERQKQLEEAARDPYEVNAVVQFKSDGVKLHPQAFGTAEMTGEQRVALEKILNDVHRSYLKAEADHSQFAMDAGIQTTTIGRFDEDLAKLENELWTAVDTQLPIVVQKLLRQRLPLYADSNTPMPLAMHASSQDPFAGGGAGMMMATPPAAMGSAMGGSAMSGMAGGMSGIGTGGPIATSNLRYQQLLGWKQTRLPLRITIRAQGKWRRWEIGVEGIGPPTIGPSGQAIYPKTYTVLDSGEAPELPSSLKRFWREAGSGGAPVPAVGFSFNSSNANELAAPHDTPEAVFQRASRAYAVREWHRFADCFTEDARDELAIEQLFGAAKVYAQTEFAISSGAEPSQETLNRSSQYEEFVQSLEDTFPNFRLQSPEAEEKMDAVTEKLLQNLYSRTERRAIAVQFLRELFGNQSRDYFMLSMEFFHSALPHRGGFEDLKLAPFDKPDPTTAFGTYIAKGTEKRQPIWFKRKDPGSGWKIDGLVDVSILNQSGVSEAQPTTPATAMLYTDRQKRDWHTLSNFITEDGRDEWVFEQLSGYTGIVEYFDRISQQGEIPPLEQVLTVKHGRRLLDSISRAFPDLKLNSEERRAKLRELDGKLMKDELTPRERQTLRVGYVRDVFGDHSVKLFELVASAVPSIDSLMPKEVDFDQPIQGSVEEKEYGATFVRFGEASRSSVPSPNERQVERHPVTFKLIGGKLKVDSIVGRGAQTRLDFSEWAVKLNRERLDEILNEFDALRAASDTPWKQVETWTTQLLKLFETPADKGRIHWMAAHVYGQSDIRGHGADVIRHAQEALKYERDPVQRGWLYMYLGDAAGLVQKKEEATRWYLKGYFELLAFDLPEKAPELPTVGKFRGLVASPSENPNEDNQIVFEVLQAAEVKARKEAELVRDLVSRRNIHIQQLQNLWGRDYVEGSDAEKSLKKLATEILREDDAVMKLIHTVWPKSDPLQKPFKGINQT